MNVGGELPGDDMCPTARVTRSFYTLASESGKAAIEWSCRSFPRKGEASASAESIQNMKTLKELSSLMTTKQTSQVVRHQPSWGGGYMAPYPLV